MTFQHFYQTLEVALPTSMASDRIGWAKQIVAHDFDLIELSQLLFREAPIASRFLWTLSDVGLARSAKLLPVLPYLLEIMPQLTHIETEVTYANYWRICGVPEENEGEVIDLLFGWLQSSTINVATKSRTVFVLFELTKKYPELKNEFRLVLKEQQHKYSRTFEKRAQKILEHLD